MTKFHSAFDRPSRYNPDVSGGERTKQSMKDECDINNILRKYRKTGAIAHMNRFPAQYAEAPGYDLREALSFLEGAKAAFESLPATVRTKFDNDPATFLTFIQNPSNKDKLYEMGLANKPAPPSPSPSNQPAPNPAPTP